MKGNRRYYLKLAIMQFALIAGFLIVWQALVVFGVLNSFLFPTPVAIAENFVNVLRGNGQVRPIPNIAIGVAITLVTYAAALVVGLVAGLGIGSLSFVRQALDPYLVLFNAIPKTVFLPAFFLALGAGLGLEFWFAFVGAVIPITLNMIYSVATVPSPLVSAARSMGASTFGIYSRVVLPSVMPTFLASARLIFGIVFAGILLSQIFVGQSGFGYLVAIYSERLLMVQLYVITVVASLIGIFAYLLLLGIERRFTRWNRVR